jgi:hypothetical protein
MSRDDRKTLSPEILPPPERPAAGTPRQRVITQLRRVLSGAFVGGLVTSVTSLGCDPGPPPSRNHPCTCPDGTWGTEVPGITFHACNCPMGAGGSGGSQDGGADGPTDVASADGVGDSDSATDGRAMDERVVDVSSEKAFDGSSDVD